MAYNFSSLERQQLFAALNNKQLANKIVEILEHDPGAPHLAAIDDAIAAVQADVDQNEVDSDDAISALQADVDQNELDADASIVELRTDIDQNEIDSDAAISTLQADVDSNEAVALAGRQAIQADVDQNEADGDADRAAIRAEIAAEVAALLGDAGTDYETLGKLEDKIQAEEARVDAILAGSSVDLDTLLELVEAYELADNTVISSIAALQLDVDQNESDADAAIAAEESRALAAEAVNAAGLVTLKGDAAADYDTLGKAEDKIIALEAKSDNKVNEIQGHYALLTNFYFTGGQATDTIIAVADVDTWLNVNITVDALGTFDQRPDVMQTAQSSGHTGAGTQADPIKMLLEGLTLHSSASFRAVMTFVPDEDGGRLDSRLCFTRHTGTTPSEDFAIEASSVAMESGADTEYSNTPDIQFFVGDTIDTNGAGDAGTVRFQIRSDVAGTLSMREMALFIQL
jgi:hypothetical protein